MMLSDDDLDRVIAVFSLEFAKTLNALERGFNDIRGRKGFFLNVIRPKFEVLKTLDDSYLYTVGSAICNNLALIKSYDFLTLFFRSLYEIDKVVYERDIAKAGSLKMELIIRNEQKSFKIYNNGIQKIYKNGSKKKYQREATFNNIDMNKYLPQFLLFGVYLEEIILSENQLGINQLYSGSEPLFSFNEALFSSPLFLTTDDIVKKLKDGRIKVLKDGTMKKIRGVI